jgi:hypothetical protein
MRDQPLFNDLTSLDAPALLVDLDVMDRNIARIMSACRSGSPSHYRQLWRKRHFSIMYRATRHH